MIPKKIHYVWLGGSNKGTVVENNIAQWRMLLPDYEFVEWTEQAYLNVFGEDIPKYLLSAIEARQWAFASDYIRLKVLETFGGVYLDTDVELLTSLDKFLINKSFIGMESKFAVSTAVIGSEKNVKWISELLSLYEKRDFVSESGRMDKEPNSLYIYKYFKQINSDFDSDHAIPDLSVFKRDVFSPIDFMTGKLKKSDETVAIHHFSGAWKNKSGKVKDFIIKLIFKFIGEDKYQNLKKLLKDVKRKW